ncbi:hypothetical protein, partial [Klebsiella pneumoniae]|uniref:hypothetical protein n=1 Tax=Klebsiella pneumoniae TaxID=573 RepID=UPI00272FC55C
FLLRIFAPDIDELEVVIQTFSHVKTSSNSSGAYHCGLARMLESNDFRLAALGLTSTFEPLAHAHERAHHMGDGLLWVIL